MITFVSNTTIEFNSKEEVEPFVQSLPLNSIQKKLLLEGETVVDRLDKSDFPGSGDMRHEFKIVTEEK